MIILKSPAELKAMRRAGELVARAHQLVAAFIKPGVTTRQIDTLVEEFLRKNDAVPAFKGYHGYPATICASIDAVVVHGIPNDRPLREGSILGVDIGAFLGGFCGDSAWTYPVGAIDEQTAHLLATAKEALFCGVAQAVVGNRLSDISHAIQQCAEAEGFSVVRDFVGHGVGRSMHEDPQIPNFGSPGRGPRLKSGMTLALEPMVNIGGYEVEVLEDNWTAVTMDRSLSAHFEHTVAVTVDGPLVLTTIEEG